MKTMKTLLSFAVLVLPITLHAEEGPKLGIADLVSAVRGELADAEKRLREEGHGPLFITRELELEISFLITLESKLHLV